jgi:microcystin-dependent protein
MEESNMDPFIGEVKTVSFNYPPQGYAFCNGQTVQTAQNQALYSLIGTVFGGNATAFALPDLKGRLPIGATSMGGSVSTSSYTYGTSGGIEKLSSGTISGYVSFLSPLAASLTAANMPLHTHAVDTSTLTSSGTVTVNCNDTAGSQTTGDQAYFGKAGAVNGKTVYDANVYNTTTPNKTMHSGTASFSGSVGGTVTIQPAGNATPAPVSLAVSNMPATVAVAGSTASVVQPYLVLNYIIALEGVYPTRQ